MTSETKSKWLDHGLKVLSVLVIPTVVYVFGLHATIAVQGEKVGRLETDVAELNVQVKEIESNKLVLARLEEQLKNANGKLSDIKTALNSLRD
jgi:hypothetical protein